MELPEVGGVRDGVVEVVREMGERETNGHIADDVFEDRHFPCCDWGVPKTTDEQLAVEDGLRGEGGNYILIGVHRLWGRASDTLLR